VKIVDTHQHLWDKELFHYAWLVPLPALNRSFRLSDYRDASSGLEIEKTVFVECDVDEPQVTDEVLHILRLTADPVNRIGGIVASCRPEKDGFEAYIAKLIRYPLVKGVRRILHTGPDETGMAPKFVENVARLENYGLSFDICVLARQLPVAINMAQKCPGVSFVLDHCGVPEVKDRRLDPWRAHIRELSRFPNVQCKISGLVAYADPVNWRPQDLEPFVSHAIECFGWDRVMFGSDWPVCNLTASYLRWVDSLQMLTRSAGEDNQKKLFHENAIRIYRLNDEPSSEVKGHGVK